MVDHRGKVSGLPALSARATGILSGCIGDCLNHGDSVPATDTAFCGRSEPQPVALHILLEEPLLAYPEPADGFILVGKASSRGTPHEGVVLEQVAHMMPRVLGVVRNTVTGLVGDVAERRSQGVKDVRKGTTAPVGEFGSAVPWLASAQHCLIAGRTTAEPRTLPRDSSGKAWWAQRNPVTTYACFRR